MGSSIGSGVGSLIGGILGGNAAQGDYDSAMGLTKEQLEQYKNLSVPDVEKMKLYLEELQSQGTLNPLLETAVTQGDTNFAAVTTDPRLRAAQLAALDQMSGISQTGSTAIDRAAMQDMLRQSQAQEMANRKSILENRAARGMSGSGDELAAALSASQGSSNQAQDNSLKIAAQAMQNRLGALTSSASMAQAIESGDYNRAANIAKERDTIANFNAQLQAGAQQRNVASQNEALARNLSNAQRIADANTGTRNVQQQHNKSLLQQEYENKLKRLSGMSGASANLSNAYAARGDATARQSQMIGSGIGSLMGKAFAKPNVNTNTEQSSGEVPDLFSENSDFGLNHGYTSRRVNAL